MLKTQKSSTMFILQKLNTINEKFNSNHNKEIIFNHYKNNNHIDNDIIDNIVNKLNKKCQINLYNKVDKETIIKKVKESKLISIKNIINKQFYIKKPKCNIYYFEEKSNYNEFDLFFNKCPIEPNYKYISINDKIYVLNDLTSEVKEIVGYKNHFETILKLLLIVPVFYIPTAWTIFSYPVSYLYVKYLLVNDEMKNKVNYLIKQKLIKLEYETQESIYKEIKNSDDLIVAQIVCEFYEKFFPKENTKTPIECYDLLHPNKLFYFI